MVLLEEKVDFNQNSKNDRLYFHWSVFVCSIQWTGEFVTSRISLGNHGGCCFCFRQWSFRFVNRVCFIHLVQPIKYTRAPTRPIIPAAFAVWFHFCKREVLRWHLICLSCISNFGNSKSEFLLATLKCNSINMLLLSGFKRTFVKS